MSFKLADMIGAGIFSSIGFGVFIYGKKESNFRIMMISVALMGYPLLITQTLWIYVVGTVLTAALFLFKD